MRITCDVSLLCNKLIKFIILFDTANVFRIMWKVNDQKVLVEATHICLGIINYLSIFKVNVY